MGRVAKERKEELEKSLIDISREFLSISKELGVTIHLDANHYKDGTDSLSIFVHYNNPSKNSYGITSRFHVDPEGIKGCLLDEPKWCTEVHDYEI